MNYDLLFEYARLPFVGVLLQCLDEAGKTLIPASGFIRREEERLFLYTCWHVVTGFDMNDIRVPPFRAPNRRSLRVSLQESVEQPGVATIGGLQSFEIPLYESTGGATSGLSPLWYQDDAHIPHADLNGIGLHVPYWHDVVKLELPASVKFHYWQLIAEDRILRGNMANVVPGDKCLVVGFPYGYSAFGGEQPTPVVLTRFAASDRIENRPQSFLLDSIGAPGMSGAPVFVEREDGLFLLGIYTGAVYPAGPRDGSEEQQSVTDLGTVSNLALVLLDTMQLVRTPSQALPRQHRPSLRSVVAGSP